MHSVVITGAGSGIGAATAVRLDREGWRVFAGVHDPADAGVLGRDTSDRVTVAPLDVTSAESIATFAGEVDLALGSGGLDAVVDNAGKAFAGPLETLPIEELREQFEVNVIGQVAVTQRFLPLLRRAESPRIVLVGSVGGLVAVGFAGAYHASKYAMEAIADAWRQELAPDGVDVVLVEPGPLATPIWSKAAHSLDALPKNDATRIASTRSATACSTWARRAPARTRRYARSSTPSPPPAPTPGTPAASPRPSYPRSAAWCPTASSTGSRTTSQSDAQLRPFRSCSARRRTHDLGSPSKSRLRQPVVPAPRYSNF